MAKNFFERMKDAVKPKPKFVYTTKNLGRGTANGTRVTGNGSFESTSPWTENIISIDSLAQVSSSSTNSPVNSTARRTSTEDERKTVEPIEVFKEIERESPNISFDNLDEKIKVVKERISVLKEHLKEEHLKDEHRTLFYLENRKKYLKTRKKNPFDWATTTEEAVEDLTKRYKLRTVPLQQYYTLVPKEGIAEMKRFTAAYKAITGDEPIFELVIKEAKVAPEQRKKDRDPILLANSPLGNFLFIVGVWDDEVEIVDEIIYGLK